MKKWLLLLVAVPALMCSCDKDEPDAPVFNKEELEISECLNGGFVGSSFSFVTNTTETEVVSFSPFSEPRKMLVLDYIGVGGVSVQNREAWVMGSAVYTKFTNDHLFEITKECYYSVDVPYSEAFAKLELYPYGDDGKVNNHTMSFALSSVSADSFVMNDKTMNRKK